MIAADVIVAGTGTAGVAAALAVRTGRPAAEVDADALRAELVNGGALP